MKCNHFIENRKQAHALFWSVQPKFNKHQFNEYIYPLPVNQDWRSTNQTRKILQVESRL